MEVEKLINCPLQHVLYNRRSRKIRIIFIFSMFFLSIIAVRLFYLQIFKSRQLVQLGQKNFLRTEIIPSLRGNLLDRNGKLLATNVPVFDLYWQGSGNPELSSSQYDFLTKVKSILGVDIISDEKEVEIDSAERYSRQILIKKSLSDVELYKICEQCAESSNVFVARHFTRTYPNGTLASHVVGYLRGTDSYGRVKGLYGLEWKFQDNLQGEYGYIKHIVNATGKRLSSTESRSAIAGNNIKLTLDLTLQSIVEALFSPGQAGAFVIMDPENGDILAMHSYPNFDPNAFLGPISQQKWQEQFCVDNPLLNRAIHATYPPASLFKLVTFIAGLEEKVIKQDSTFVCNGYTEFCGGRYNCLCRTGHGPLSARRALEVSCNIPCYEMAKKMSVDQFAAYATRLGLGQPTGFLFPDKKGIVPTSAWKQCVLGERWWGGETLSVSIGQSYLLVTPLQVARMVAGICSGYLVKPRILVDEEVVRSPLYISNETLAFLRDVMREVVLCGTARCLSWVRDFTASAKTGTAQTISLKRQKCGTKMQLEHAWLGGFFSYKGGKPLAIAVLVENCGSSRYAVQLVKNFFTIYKRVYK